MKALVCTKISKPVGLAFLIFFFLVSNARGANFYFVSGGNWETPSNWVTDACGGSMTASSIPQSTDNVFICAAVILNSTVTVNNLTINNGGNLSFAASTASDLTVYGNLIVNSGGTFQVVAGTLQHILKVAGSFTNNGSVDFWKSTTSNVVMHFNGNTNTVVSGGGVWNLYSIVMNKDTKDVAFEVQAPEFFTNFNSGAWTLTKGTYFHNNAQTLNLPGSGNFTINTNTIVRVGNGTLNIAPSGNELVLEGGLEITGGIVNVGNTNGNSPNSLRYRQSVNIPYINITGGFLNSFQGINSFADDNTSRFQFDMTGGTVTLNTGSSRPTRETFRITDVANSSFSMSGGIISIGRHNNGLNRSDFAVCGTNGTVNSSGGTVQFGTTTSSVAESYTFTPFPNDTLPNFKVSGPSGVNITLRPSSSGNFRLLSLYIDAGKTFDVSSTGDVNDGRTMTLTGSNLSGHAFFDNNNEATDHFLYRQGTVVITSSATIRTNAAADTSYRRFYNLSIASPENTIKLTSGFGVGRLLTFNGGTLDAPLRNIYLYDSNPLSITNGSVITLSHLIFNGAQAQDLPGYNYNCSIMAQANGTQIKQQGKVTCRNLKINGNRIPGNGVSYIIDNSDSLIVREDIDIGCSGCTASSNADFNSAKIKIDGNFNLNTNSLVNAMTSTIHVAKDWNNTSTPPAVGFNEGSSTVFFTGSGKNQIKCTQCTASSPETFNNLGINKEGRDTLLTTVRVNNLLSFTKGYFISTSTNKMVVGPSATVSGASDASFVDGPVQKINAGTFDFPIGDSSRYRPLGISPTTTGSTFTAEYIKGPAPQPTYSFTTKASGLLFDVSQCEYWTLNRDAGSNSTRVKLSYSSTSCGVSEYATYKVTNWQAQWIDLGRGGPNTSGNASAGFVENSSAVSSFGIFTLLSCPKPTVTVIGATTFCQGKSVTLTSEYPTTNVWAPGGQTTNAITVTTSGTYTVTATTSAGCTATSLPINVIVNALPAQPTTTTFSPSPLCDSAIVTLTATGPAGISDYRWYDDNVTATSFAGGPSYTTLTKIKANRQYYVTSRDGNGCESTPRTVVNVSITNSPVIPVATDKFICDPGEIILSAGGSTGGYIWYDVSSEGSPVSYGSNFVIPNLTATKTYYVAASASGCESGRLKVTANLYTRPSSPIGIPDSICGGGPVTLKATGSTSGYKWYKTSGTATVETTTASYTTPSLTATTPFYVSAMSPEGCESGSRTEVLAKVKKIPALPIAVNGTHCGPGPVNLSVSGVTGSYKWYKDNTDLAILSSLASYTPNISSTTTYYVSSDSLSCMSSRIPVVATIFPQPALPTGSDVARCGPGRVTLVASASTTSFKWYLDSTSTSVKGNLSTYNTDSILTNTKYYVASFSTDGCESNGRTKINAIINPLPSSPSVKDGYNCGPGPVDLEASGSANEFIWYSEAVNGDSLFTGTKYKTKSLISTTDFYVLGKSSLGCLSTNKTKVTATIKAIPVEPTTTDSSRCGPGDVVLSAKGSSENKYKWYTSEIGGSPIDSLEIFTAKNLTNSQTYYVASQEDGCQSNRVDVFANILPKPSLPSAIDRERCGPGSIVLSASLPNSTFKWYLDSISTVVQGILPTYTTDSILTNTKYYVSSVNIYGCESDGRTKINAIINQLPSSPTVKDGSNCGPGTVDLEASGGANEFIWYSKDVNGDSLFSGAKYKTQSLSTTTHFYVLAKSNLGCYSAAKTEVTATIKAIPGEPTPIDGSRCGPGDVVLSATGSLENKYKWYTSENGGSALDSLESYAAKNLSANQTYYVASQENGCQSSRVGVLATINPIPSKPIAVGDSSCGRGDLDLLASGASDYYWYSDALSAIKLDSGAVFTAQDISATQNFFVSAVSDKGCESSDRTQVQALILDIPDEPTAKDTANCGPGSVKLIASASAGTFKWYDTGNNEIGNQQELPTGIIDSDSIFYVSSIVNGCESIKKPVFVTINPVPPIPTVKDTSICGVHSVTLIASGSPDTYRWYNKEDDDSSMAVNEGDKFLSSISSTVSYYVSSISSQKCESQERAKVTVSFTKNPEAPVSVPKYRCGPGPIDLSASGLSQNYLWYTSKDSLLGNEQIYKALNVKSDSVFYVVSDSAGCASSKTLVQAFIKPLPPAPTTKDTATCVAGSMTLSASGSPESYKWYNGQDVLLEENQSITINSISQTTTFYVESSLNGCASEVKTPLTVTLNSIPPAPQTNVSPVCGGGKVALSASGSVGSYYWYETETSTVELKNSPDYLTDSLSASKLFYVLAEKDNCKSERVPVTALVNPLPDEPLTVGDTICDSETTLILKASGNFEDFIWYASLAGNDSLGSGNSLTVNLSSTYTYYVASLDNKGCKSSRTPVLALVNPSPIKPVAIGSERCGPGPVILSASGFDEYKWYETENGSPFANHNDTLEVNSVTENRSYYVTSIAKGCESQEKTKVDVTINPLPLKPEGVENSVCEKGSVLLSAKNSPDKYYWYTGNSDTDIPVDTTLADYKTPSITATTKFYVSSVDVIGCESDKTEVTAYVKPLPEAPITISDSACINTRAMILKAEGIAENFKWYSSDTSSISINEGKTFSITNLPVTTSYYVSSETEGCSSSTRTIVTAIVKSLPDKPVTINDTICGGGNVELRAIASGADSFIWYNGGIELVNEHNDTLVINITKNSVFAVASYFNGCESSEKTDVLAIVKPFPQLPVPENGFSCGPGRVTLNATGDTGNLLWYKASEGGLSAGTGEVIVTSYLEKDTTYYVTSESQGCENATRVAVKAVIKIKPEVPLTEDLKICGAQTVTLVASGAPTDGEYLWFVPDSSEVKYSGAEYQINANATMTMNVAVGLDGCKSERVPVTVKVDTIPAVPFTADVSRCGAGEVKLQASGSTGLFNWYGTNSQEIISTGKEFDLGNLIASTSYFVSSFDENCESPKVEVKAIVNPASIAGTLESPATVVCNGTNSGTITAVGVEGTVKSWLVSGNNFITASAKNSGEKELEYNNISTPTGYKIIVQNGNCPADTSDAFILSVDNSPMTIGGTLLLEDSTASGGVLKLEDYTGDIVRWESSNDGITYAPMVSTDSLYKFSIRSIDNFYRAVVKSGTCPERTSEAYYLGEFLKMKIYTSFSPNGDGINDSWFIDGIEAYPDNKVHIFNRWGNLVYEANGYDNNIKVWKGTANTGMLLGNDNTLPDGTYFYNLDWGKGKKPSTGYVVIKR
ncbi:MAG: gliding motility-associated C-terminal domain-containing protein [Sporocytophaga sp.]|uniref:Ig-like domain-containing protein n=1 Tax=Sporocytophaga sp. TaxID=2231183 RepID=UPI001B1564E9|nr:gliding motility-associated C-terminal domain-containing protein [Sporocytophaga sp.]MBO9699840.1 gliding motility-associated C-terminal domain-containing protein [Sporocytophaga sp.]